jgi:hypothetical protein
VRVPQGHGQPPSCVPVTHVLAFTGQRFLHLFDTPIATARPPPHRKTPVATTRPAPHGDAPVATDAYPPLCVASPSSKSSCDPEGPRHSTSFSSSCGSTFSTHLVQYGSSGTISGGGRHGVGPAHSQWQPARSTKLRLRLRQREDVVEGREQGGRGSRRTPGLARQAHSPSLNMSGQNMSGKWVTSRVDSACSGASWKHRCLAHTEWRRGRGG